MNQSRLIIILALLVVLGIGILALMGKGPLREPVVPVGGRVIGLSDGSFLINLGTSDQLRVAVTENTQFEYPEQTLVGQEGLRALKIKDKVIVRGTGSLDDRHLQALSVQVTPAPANEPEVQVFNITGEVLEVKQDFLTLRPENLGDLDLLLVQMDESTQLKDKQGAPVDLAQISKGARVLVTTAENARDKSTVQATSVRLLD